MLGTVDLEDMIKRHGPPVKSGTNLPTYSSQHTLVFLIWEKKGVAAMGLALWQLQGC